jgi:hypothetical protein
VLELFVEDHFRLYRERVFHLHDLRRRVGVVEQGVHIAEALGREELLVVQFPIGFAELGVPFFRHLPQSKVMHKHKVLAVREMGRLFISRGPQVVEYGVQDVRQAVELRRGQPLPSLAPGRLDDGQHGLDFVAAGRGELDVEAPPVGRVGQAAGQPFLAQQIDDAGHGGRVFVGSAGDFQLAQPLLAVQHLEDDPLVDGDARLSSGQLLLEELLHALGRPFQDEARELGRRVGAGCGKQFGHDLAVWLPQK